MTARASASGELAGCEKDNAPQGREAKGQQGPLDAVRCAPLLLLVGLLAACTPERGWKVVGGQRKVKFVLVEKSKEGSEAVYQIAIGELCGRAAHCMLLFWSDRRFVPSRLPMSDFQAEAKVASYVRNTSTGFEQFLWDCRLNSDPNKCFR